MSKLIQIITAAIACLAGYRSTIKQQGELIAEQRKQLDEARLKDLTDEAEVAKAREEVAKANDARVKLEQEAAAAVAAGEELEASIYADPEIPINAPDASQPPVDPTPSEPAPEKTPETSADAPVDSGTAAASESSGGTTDQGQEISGSGNA